MVPYRGLLRRCSALTPVPTLIRASSGAMPLTCLRYCVHVISQVIEGQLLLRKSPVWRLFP